MRRDVDEQLYTLNQYQTEHQRWHITNLALVAALQLPSFAGPHLQPSVAKEPLVLASVLAFALRTSVGW